MLTAAFLSQLTLSLSVFLKGQAAFSVRRAAFSLRQSECDHVMMIHLCITTLFFFFPQKPWMFWGPVVAVALTAVTAAALFRT